MAPTILRPGSWVDGKRAAQRSSLAATTAAVEGAHQKWPSPVLETSVTPPTPTVKRSRVDHPRGANHDPRSPLHRTTKPQLKQLAPAQLERCSHRRHTPGNMRWRPCRTATGDRSTRYGARANGHSPCAFANGAEALSQRPAFGPIEESLRKDHHFQYGSCCALPAWPTPSPCARTGRPHAPRELVEAIPRRHRTVT